VPVPVPVPVLELLVDAWLLPLLLLGFLVVVREREAAVGRVGVGARDGNSAADGVIARDGVGARDGAVATPHDP
jgi:hypothetical protein